MSQNVDERVVKMEFDNSDFEKNTKQTLGTIDKLKSSLDFTGAGKGLDGLTDSSKRVQSSMDGIRDSADAVNVKFSALEVAGITMVARLTNAFINLGTRMVKSLSIDPITQGYSKYEQSMNATQTIMAATDKSLSEVEDQLKRVTFFTDETSYAYTDIVSSIGKFTSNGLDLSPTVTAMQGIATWAAQSGVNAQAAGSAFYNLSQTIGNGYVDYANWKSIQNLNMATTKFKTLAADTAVSMGALEKKTDDTGKAFYKLKGQTDDAYASVNTFFTSDSLSRDKWFTTDILMAVTKKYGEFADLVYQISEASGKSAYDVMQSIDAASEGSTDDLNFITNTLNSVSGATQQSTDEIKSYISSTEMQMSESAYKIAQQSKTASDALSAIKDSVSSQWMTTFKILFGDLNESIDLWGNMYDILYKIFGVSGEVRNSILSFWDAHNGGTARLDLMQGLLNIWESLSYIFGKVEEALKPLMPGFQSLSEAVQTVGLKLYNATEGFFEWTKTLPGIDAVAEAVSGVGDAAAAVTEPITESYGALKDWVTAVVRGDYGNGQDRIDALGDKYQTIQDKVNEIHDAYGTWQEGLDSIDPSIQLTIEKTQTASEATDGATTAVEAVAEATKETSKVLDKGKTIYDDVAYSIKGLISAFDILKKVAGYVGQFFKVFIWPIVKNVGKIFFAVTGTVGDFVTQVDNMMPSVEEMGQRFQDIYDSMSPFTSFLGGIVDGIVNFIRNLRGGLKEATDSVKNFYDNSKFLKLIVEQIGKLFDWLGGLISGFGSDLNKVDMDGFSDGVSTVAKVGEAVGKVFKWVDDRLYDLTTSFGKLDFSWITHIFDPILGLFSGDIFASIGGWFSQIFADTGNAAGNGIDLLVKVYDAVKDFCSNVMGVVGDFKDNLLGFSIFDLVTKKFGLIGKVIGMIGKFNTVSGLAETASADTIGPDALNGVVTAAGGMSTAFGAISSYTVDANGKIEETSGDIQGQTGLLGKLKKAMGKYGDLLENIASYFKTKILPYVKGVGDWFGQLFSSIGGFFKKNILPVSSYVFDRLKGVIKKAFDYLTTGDILSKIGTLVKFFAGLQLVRLLKGAADFTTKFAKVGDGVTNVLNSFAKSLKAEDFKKRVDSTTGCMKAIALLFLAVAVSLYIISQIDQKDLDKAIDAIGKVTLIVTTAIAALMIIKGAIDKWNSVSKVVTTAVQPKTWKDVITNFLSGLVDGFKGIGKALDKAGKGILIAGIGVGVFFFMMALQKLLDVIKAYNDFKIEDYEGAFEKVAKAIFLLAGAMALMSKAVNSWSGIGMIALIAVMWSFVFLLLKFLDVLTAYDQLKLDNVDQTFTTLFSVMGMISICMAIMEFAAKGTGVALFGATTLLMTFIDGLVKMSGVIGTLGSIDQTSLDKGFQVVVGLMGVLMGCIALIELLVSKNVQKNGNKATLAFLAISVMMLAFGRAISIIADAMTKIGSMDTESFIKGIVGIGLIIAAFAGILYLAGKLSNGGAVAAFALVIVALTGSLIVLTLFPADKLMNSASILVEAIIFIGLVLAVISKIMKGDASAMYGFAALILALSVSLAILTYFPVQALFRSVVILSAAMIALGVSMRLATGFAGDQKAMFGFAACIGVLALALVVLSNIPADKLLGSALALGTVMIALGAAMGLAKSFSSDLGSMLGFAAVIVALAGSLYLLSLISPDKLWPAVGAMSVLEIVTGLFIKIADQAKTSIGTLAMVAVIIGILGGVMYLLAQLPVENVLGVSLALSAVLLSLSFSMEILSAIPWAAAGKAAVLMAGLLLGSEGLLALMGYIATLGDIADYIEKGVWVMQKVGEGIGSFLGGIVAGYEKATASALPEIAKDLASFMETAKPFFSGLDNIDTSKVDAIKNLADGMRELASLNDTQIDGDNLKANFSAFGDGIKTFISSVSSIENFDKIAPATEAIANIMSVMSNTPRTGGLWQDIVGGQDFKEFGNAMSNFGIGLSSFNTSISGMDEASFTKIQNAIEPMKSLMSAMAETPSTGGLLGWVTGDQEFGDFANSMQTFGNGLANYFNALSGLDDNSFTKISNSTQPLMHVIETMAKTPLSGGALDWLTGSQDFASFPSHMDDFGKGLVNYYNAIKEVDDLGKINQSASAIAVIADAMTNMKTVGSIPTMTAFGSSLDTLGDKITSYQWKLTNGNFDYDLISQSGDAIKSISEAVTTIPSDTTYISTFGTNLEELGDGIKGYYDSVSQINLGDLSGNLSTMVASFIGSLVDTFKNYYGNFQAIGVNIVTNLSSGITSQQDFATSSATSVVDAITSAISGDLDTTNYSGIGSDMASDLATGFDSQKPYLLTVAGDAINAFVKVLRDGMTGVKVIGNDLAEALEEGADSYDRMWSVGYWAVQGLKDGLARNAYLAVKASHSLADAVVSEAQNTVEQGSPAQKFIDIGMYCDMGLALGLSKYSNLTDKAAHTMASSVVQIAGAVTDSINTDPVIRPVLDLSDVSAKSRTLSGMLDLSPVTAYASQAASSVETRLQANVSSSNDDVISAINTLGSRLSTGTGNTYQINGITYDDGSEVQRAVATLVRAAKIERRI